MTEPLVFEADRGTFLERQGRYHRLIEELRAGLDDVQPWADRMQGLLDEAEFPDLVIGTRYRIRYIGAEFEVKHAHGTTASGRTIGFDLPLPVGSAYAELEGRYAGRTWNPFGVRGLLVFEVAPSEGRALADLDVLRIEELR